jgi:hypothetical protein
MACTHSSRHAPKYPECTAVGRETDHLQSMSQKYPKMMKLTHVRHSKLTLKSPNNMVKELGRRGSENDVIHIEQQIGGV